MLLPIWSRCTADVTGANGGGRGARPRRSARKRSAGTPSHHEHGARDSSHAARCFVRERRTWKLRTTDGENARRHVRATRRSRAGDVLLQLAWISIEARLLRRLHSAISGLVTRAALRRRMRLRRCSVHLAGRSGVAAPASSRHDVAEGAPPEPRGRSSTVALDQGRLARCGPLVLRSEMGGSHVSGAGHLSRRAAISVGGSSPSRRRRAPRGRRRCGEFRFRPPP